MTVTHERLVDGPEPADVGGRDEEDENRAVPAGHGELPDPDHQGSYQGDITKEELNHQRILARYVIIIIYNNYYIIIINMYYNAT